MKIKRKDLLPELNPAVLEIIEKLSSSRTKPYKIVQRAQIIRLLSEGNSIVKIADKVNIHRNRVTTWRARFIKALPEINEAGQHKDLKKCQELIVSTLSDRKRPGAPRKFTDEEKDSIVAVACLNPEELGNQWPISNWSHMALAWYLTENGIVEDISASSVGRCLREHKLKPHKRLMWIHSPDKIENLDLFVQKVREISALLKSSVDLYSEGVQILSIDEKPGIQANCPLFKTVPASPGKACLQEMFYSRNGRTDLIQCLNVGTGDLLNPYLNETHKEADFADALSKAVREQLSLTPDDKVIVMCDNFSTHVSESVVRFIDSLLGLDTPVQSMGMKGVSGNLENMDTRRDFLADSSHQVYFVFTPKHASWLNPVECYFSIIEKQLLKNGSFESVELLEEKIKAYAA